MAKWENEDDMWAIIDVARAKRSSADPLLRAVLTDAGIVVSRDSVGDHITLRDGQVLYLYGYSSLVEVLHAVFSRGISEGRVQQVADERARQSRIDGMRRKAAREWRQRLATKREKHDA
ncbi:hypothetical protein [Hydrocarboniphaga effusa]|uniref:hypothetical protein n=1 Tax=Hydrocarboniphaga effusa TaxID=243629 RepID=UPI0031377CD5